MAPRRRQQRFRPVGELHAGSVELAVRTSVADAPPGKVLAEEGERYSGQVVYIAQDSVKSFRSKRASWRPDYG